MIFIHFKIDVQSLGRWSLKSVSLVHDIKSTCPSSRYLSNNTNDANNTKNNNNNYNNNNYNNNYNNNDDAL